MTPKLPRPSSPEDRLELKAATRRALSLARVTAFAMVTRVDAPALSKYAAPQEDGHFMPIDVLLDLERDIGSPVILETLAALQGYRLVPVHEPQGGEDQFLGGITDIADITREGGDVVQSLAAAMRDGKIDGAEKRTVRMEIAENIAVLHRLDRKIAGA